MKNLLNQLTAEVSRCLSGDTPPLQLGEMIGLVQNECNLAFCFPEKDAGDFQSIWKMIAHLIYTIHISARTKQKKIVLAQLYSLCSVMQRTVRCYTPAAPWLVPALIPPQQLYKKLHLAYSFNSDSKAVVLLRSFIPSLQAGESITSQQWLWWCCFYQYTAESSVPPSHVSLEDILVHLNFNAPAFKQYLADDLKMALLHAGSLSDKISVIRDRFIKYQLQQNAASCAYMQHECSVHDFMLHLCGAEIKFLDLWASGNNPQSAAHLQNAAFNLQTCLSVSQAALFVRLMIDVGIVKSDNHTALLKQLAGIMSTPHTANVSAESLRVKFYTPEKASKDILKDYLFMMINQLRNL